MINPVSNLEIEALENLTRRFYDNPCRGIVAGMNEIEEMLQLSWIMGRSDNSQNRVYVVKKGVVKTKPADESKVKDPSLIIYTAMKGYTKGSMIGPQVVSNGFQTDTIIDNMERTSDGMYAFCFRESLKQHYCEPDPPNFTPRITAVQNPSDMYTVILSILKADPFAKEQWLRTEKESELSEDNFKSRKEYLDEIDNLAGLDRNQFPTTRNFFERETKPGYGYCLTTYVPGSKELNSFEGEPFIVPLRGSIKENMGTIFDNLEPEWRVAIAGKRINHSKVYIQRPINTKKVKRWFRKT